MRARTRITSITLACVVLGFTSCVRDSTDRDVDTSESELNGATVSAEMKKLRALMGSWQCNGTLRLVTPAGPQELSVAARYDINSILGGKWITGRMESEPTPENPAVHIERDYWSYSPNAGGYVRFAADNFGDFATAKAATWNQSLDLAGTATAFGQPTDYALQVRLVSPKVMVLKGVVGPEATPFVNVSYRCVKQEPGTPAPAGS